MKNFLNVKLFLHLFVLFVIRKMKPQYTFFTLVIKQNLFGLNYKSYWIQKYFFHKIRHRVLSLVFQIIKKILKSLTIWILYLSIICVKSGIKFTTLRSKYVSTTQKMKQSLKKWHVLYLLTWTTFTAKGAWVGGGKVNILI